MHAGRVTHQDTTGGHEVVAPSAIAIDGETRTYAGKKPFPVPRALTTEELPGIVEEFVTASRKAVEAGFDGVELHSANGYLLHEFLTPAANQRDDIYGGSPGEPRPLRHRSGRGRRCSPRRGPGGHPYLARAQRPGRP